MKKLDQLPPQKRLEPLPPDERAYILERIKDGDAEYSNQWREKVRRFASLYARNLSRECKRRFGSEAQCHLEWMAEILLTPPTFLSDCPIDAHCLGAVFYCLDALAESRGGQLRKEAEQQYVSLSHHLGTAGTPDAPHSKGSKFIFSEETWRAEAKTAKGIVIICPSPFSLYSLTVAKLLLHLEVPIAHVIVRSFSLKRFSDEWRRDGYRLIRKIWRKLLLKSNENPEQTSISLKDICSSFYPEFNDINSLAESKKIPVSTVDELDEAYDSIVSSNCAVAVFTGGGMVSSKLIQTLPLGIINVHMGILPDYKGMDVVQAPILEGRFNHIGVTAHLMEPALDTGPILSHFPTTSLQYTSLGALRNELMAVMPFVAVDAALGHESGRLEAEKQDAGGRQYYVTHKRLGSLVGQVMKHDARNIGSSVETDAYNALRPIAEFASQTSG